MAKKNLFIIMTLLCMIIAPVNLMAKSSVQKLKDPVNNYADLQILFEEIMDQGGQSVSDLIALLNEDTSLLNADAKNQSMFAKVTAMNLLSELKAASALDVLADLLMNSENLSEINNSARAIGHIGGNNAYKILEQALVEFTGARNELDQTRKKAVIAALGLCDNAKAIPFLLNELNNASNSEIIRIYAAGSLGLLGSQAGIETALAGLHSDDMNIQLAAIRALGLIGSTDAISSLLASSSTNNDYVFQQAINDALVQIDASNLSGDDKAAFIGDQLARNPKSTALVQWGTIKLNKMKTTGAKKALQSLSMLDGDGYSALRHAAKIRLKTIQ